MISINMLSSIWAIFRHEFSELQLCYPLLLLSH